VTLNIDIDEGKPFYVRRIEFQGNTLTRDRVIRRELMLEEGQVYNSQLWEMSLLRLNQLGYFDPLKVDQDSEAHQDTEAGTVDLLLKVKEKGKNSIGLNGGVSGSCPARSWALNYQTNNFLGLGETLSVQANLGNVNRQLLFGFTSPTSAIARSIWASSLQHQVRLQLGEGALSYLGTVRKPDYPAGVLAAELQQLDEGLELVGELSAPAA
jgi:outer membrane protein assembly factor BamA